MDAKTGSMISYYFWVYEGITPIPGLGTLDFTRGVLFNGILSEVPVNVYEVDASLYPGFYRTSFVPDQRGGWYPIVKHPDYEMRPLIPSEEVRVLDWDVDDVFHQLPAIQPGTLVLIGTDYGGIDNLRYMDLQGTGIADATVWAYLKEDWEGGLTGQTYVQSKTKTDVYGKLTFPLILSSGYWYSLVYFRANSCAHDVKEIYVEAD